INPERFHAADVSILILHHGPVGHRVSVITRSRLGHRPGRRRVGALRYLGRSGKGGIGGHSIVHLEREHFPEEHINGLNFSDEKVRPAGGRRRPTIVTGKQGETGGGARHVPYYAPQWCASLEIKEIEGKHAHSFIG